MWSALSYSISSPPPNRKKPKPTIINNKNTHQTMNKKNPKILQSAPPWMFVLPLKLCSDLNKVCKSDWTKPVQVWDHELGSRFAVCGCLFSPDCLYIKPRSWYLDIFFYIYSLRRNCATGYQCKKGQFHLTSLRIEHQGQWWALLTQKMLFLSS